MDWDLIWMVERDICFLYHELSEAAGIDGDLAFGSVYVLPYWDYLSLNAAECSDLDRSFVRDGSLVMILAMAWDVLDGSGTYILPHLAVCQERVAKVDAEDERTARLVQVVYDTLDAIHERPANLDSLFHGSIWVNREYVHGYFVKAAARFSSGVT